MGIKGNLSDVSLPDLFQVLSISQKSGTLLIKNDKDRASIIFDHGKIVQVSMENYRKNIGKILVDKGFMDNDQLLESIRIQRTSPQWKQLGSICVEEGYITREQLEEAVKSLITEAITEIILWRDGAFSFEAGDVKMDDEISLDMKEVIVRSGLSSDFILLEGSRMLDERIEDVKRSGFEQGDLEFLERFEEEGQKERIEQDVLDDFAKSVLDGMDLSFFDSLRERSEKGRHVKMDGNSRELAAIYTEVRMLKDRLSMVEEEQMWQEFSLSLMRYASEVTGRVILLKIGGGYAVGYGHMGFPDELSMNEEVRTLRVPLEKQSVLQNVFLSKESFLGDLEETAWNEYLIRKSGAKLSDEIYISPIIIGGEVRMLLYADSHQPGKKIENLEGLEAFIYQAEMALEIAILKKRLAEKP